MLSTKNHTPYHQLTLSFDTIFLNIAHSNHFSSHIYVYIVYADYTDIALIIDTKKRAQAIAELVL